MVVQRLGLGIPERSNADDVNIDSAWFNTLRTAIKAMSSPTKIVLTYEDLQTAALTNTLNLFNLEAKEQVEIAQGKHSIAFTGGAISALTLELGVAGFVNKYTPAEVPFSIFQAVSDAARFRENLFMEPESYAGVTALQLKVTSVGANLSELTQGHLEIWIWSTLLP